MKVVHVTTIDVGGAYKAAVRLHEGLLSLGVDSSILLRTKVNPQNVGTEVFSTRIGRFCSKVKNLYNLLQKDGDIEQNRLGTDISGHELIQSADIIVLHWINSFLTEKEIERLGHLGKPILWFMHDMWLFTGGCHVAGRCSGYLSECVDCPMTHKRSQTAHANFTRKKQCIADMQMTVAGPSKWIVQCAQNSSILEQKEIYCLPNMLDINKFCPQKDAEKQHRKKVILFGAADVGTENRNKGFVFLLEALRKLPESEYRLVIFGNTDKNIEVPSGFEVTEIGYVTEEEKLVRVYQAADVFVTPSLQESFGYTACEALACGTPVVCFPVGGLKEQVIHKENGYIAAFKDSADMANGIIYCAHHREELSVKARQFAIRFSYEKVAPEYIRLFERMLERNNDSDHRLF